MRIGNGYDVHRLVIGRKLIIGGVEIPYDRGLQGHSDADVLVHAIMDSILGACGEKDIGHFFPDDDKSFKNISSIFLLQKVFLVMKEKGYNIVNIDCIIAAQAPKMAPYLDEMKMNIADTLKCNSEQINIKATTTEGLGFVGKGKGIEAYAVCLLEKS
ncbi:MAG: 2-C-methyl-D-erythritol 2,4-cyclodiphosphate synthase [Bacillota bacterium]